VSWTNFNKSFVERTPLKQVENSPEPTVIQLYDFESVEKGIDSRLVAGRANWRKHIYVAFEVHAVVRWLCSSAKCSPVENSPFPTALVNVSRRGGERH
jgi:hypothetical protein